MSTFILWFRAGVMLACVTAVPLTAAFKPGLFAGACKAISECVKRLTDDGFEAAHDSSKEQITELARQPMPQPVAHVAVAGGSGRSSESAAPVPVKSLPSGPVAIGASSGTIDSGPAPPAGASAKASPQAELVAWQREAAQLQHLGAVHYALQEWGSGDGVYRFHCRVAVSGDPSCQRHFSAIDADAGRAVRSVIDRVREFRRGISNPTQSASTFAESEPQ